MDAGSNDGVKEGMTACVDDNMGWELFCGKIERVKTTVAAVEAPDRFEAYFEQGLQVRVMELGGEPGHRRTHEGSGGDPTQEAPGARPIRRGAFWTLGFVTTPVLPYVAAFPDFSVESRLSGKGSVWAVGPETKMSRFGARLGRRQPWSQKFDHEIDFVWRSVSPVRKQVDYDLNDPQVYASEVAQFTDYSISWDFLSPTLEEGFSPGWIAGSAAQYVSYSYTSTIVDDTNGSQTGDLASSKARLLGVAARLGARLEYLWSRTRVQAPKSAAQSRQGHFGMSFVALVPLYSKTTWAHGTHNLPKDMPGRDASQSDLEDVVALKRSRLGLESSVYLGWTF